MQPLNNSQGPTLKVNMDRNMIWHRGDSVRFAVAEIEAPERVVAEGDADRKPLNLGVVIDRSGSMSGGQLASAKQATCQIIDQLENGDRLSVVCFGSEVQTINPGVLLTASNRDDFKRQVQMIDCGGCTDLFGGWLQGAECVATALSEFRRNQEIVLSDGYANQGVVDPSLLTQHASGLLERGITTSCIGIGDGYCMDQLQALSRGGGGRLHDAEIAEEISRAMLGDLGEAQNTVLENVALSFELPGVTDVSCVGSYIQNGRQWQCGSMAGGAIRRIVLKLRFGAGSPGHELQGSFTMTARRVDTGEDVSAVSRPIVVTHASGTDNNNQLRNIEQSMKVADAWHSQIVSHATSLNREFDYRGASRFIERELSYFKRYSRELPNGLDLLKDLERFSSVVVREMEERTRKNIHMGIEKMARMEAEFKVNNQMSENWKNEY